MNIIKKLLTALGVFFTHFWQIVIAVFNAEEQQIMADALPLMQGIAVTIQNEQPGLNAQNFIPALVAAAIPALEAEGLKLAHTAIATVAATIAHDLAVPDTAGNAGVLPGGNQGPSA